MNLSPSWAEFFVNHGFEAIHWSAIGEISARDSEILDYAAANSFIVFTHDLDFGTLLAIGKSSGPSVIQLRSQEVLPSVIGELVLRAVNSAASHLEMGALVTIDPSRQRVRLFPI